MVIKTFKKSGKIDHYGKSFGNSEIFGDGKVIKREFPASEGSVNRFYSLDAWWDKRNITLTDESAFFDVPKPSKAEKNKGLDGFESNKKVEHRFGRYRCKKCNKLKLDHSPCICEKPDFERIETNEGNNHATVKPVKLFTYLTELFSKKGDTVLDCFMGSGSTGVACVNLGREFEGIEINEGYFKIAEKRIKEASEQQKL